MRTIVNFLKDMGHARQAKIEWKRCVLELADIVDSSYDDVHLVPVVEQKHISWTALKIISSLLSVTKIMKYKIVEFKDYKKL